MMKSKMKIERSLICLVVLSSLYSCSENSKANRAIENSNRFAQNNSIVSSELPSMVNLNPDQKSILVAPIVETQLNCYADFSTKQTLDSYLQGALDSRVTAHHQELKNYSAEADYYYKNLKNYSRPDNDQIQKITTIYNQQIAETEKSTGYHRTYLNTFDTLGTVASGYLGSTGVGFIPAISFEIGKNAMVKVIESRIESFEKQSKDQAVSVIVDKFKDLKDFEREKWNSIDLSNPEEARKQALELTRDVADRLMPKDLDSEQSTAVRSNIAVYLAESSLSLLKEYQSVQSAVDHQQNLRITNAEKNIVEISETVYQINHRTAAQINNLYDNQKNIIKFVQEQSQEIKNDLSDIKGKLSDVDSRTKFMADYMFGKMSTSEQIAMLQSGHYGDVKSKAVIDLLAQKEKMREKEKFMNEFNGLMNDIQGIAQIAKNIGLDDQIYKDAMRGVQIATTAMNASEMISKNNYIGAAAAVTGLFGAQGPSPEESRHQQLQQQLAKMDKKLDDIIELQKKTHEMLSKISQQIYQSTQYLAKEIYSSRYIQLTQGEVLESLLNKELNSCLVLRASAFDQYHGSYSQLLIGLTKSNAEALSECARTLDHRFYVDALQPKFNYSTYLKSTDIVNPEFQEHYYLALREYIFSKMKDQQIQIFGASVLDPVGNYRAFQEKNKSIELQNSDLKSMGLDQVLSDRKLYSVAVLDHTKIFLDLFPLISIYQNQRADSGILSAANSELGKKQFIMLQNALNWVQKAIAQETVLNGDITLELLYQDLNQLDKKDCKIDSDRSSAYCVLQMNENLRKNLLVYMIKKDLAKSGQSLMALQAALKMSRAGQQHMLDKVLGRTLKYKFDEKTNQLTAIEFVDRDMKFPTLNTISEGKIEHHPLLTQLVALRSEIFNKMTEMKVNSFLSEEQRQYLTYKVVPGI